jgi:hypothetical protein
MWTESAASEDPQHQELVPLAVVVAVVVEALVEALVEP